MMSRQKTKISALGWGVLAVSTIVGGSLLYYFLRNSSSGGTIYFYQ